jgi:hypothetical protein
MTTGLSEYDIFAIDQSVFRTHVFVLMKGMLPFEQLPMIETTVAVTDL